MESHSNSGRRWYRKLITVAVVLTVLIVPLTGAVAAQEGDATENGSFVAAQGEKCTGIQTFVGTKTPREFYDYRLPDENNSYANETGQSYSAEGLTDLQRANTSVVFLYRQVPDESDQITGPLQPDEPRAEDQSLSLVFVHGSLENDSEGGAVTFDITGLSEDGNWTVKDDEYDGLRSYDNWSADSGDTVVDWTWQQGSTDGGVYTGLDEDDTVTIRPAFNEDAALWEEHYDGRVDDWELLSNETSDGGNATENNSTFTRIPLDKRGPLQLSGDDCEAVTERNVTDEEPTVDSGEDTDEGPIVIGDEEETEAAETDEETDTEAAETDEPTEEADTEEDGTDEATEATDTEEATQEPGTDNDPIIIGTVEETEEETETDDESNQSDEE